MGIGEEIRKQSLIVWAIWAVLFSAFAVAMFQLRWSLAFVSVAAFALTTLPILLQSRLGVRLPVSFVAAIALFIFATIFLGEAADFYNRYWWWDILLHGGSALGFGMIGFLAVFMMFEGDRFAAPASAIAFFGFCFAITIGALWEVFEFGMDQLFGLNMQKSGLLDTMGDLIVDTVGAAIGSVAGYLFLKGRRFAGLTRLIRAFIAQNRERFRKLRR
ncbi:MAG: hypothetical protein R3D84_13665 [Paracoccaceae bacterium]